MGFWSHAGLDGPIGDVATSGEYALYSGSSQMSIEGWGDINFNWSDNGAMAGFYGCNAGNEGRGSSFAQNVSGLSNFSNVSVWGQPTSSFPSYGPDVSVTSWGRSAGLGFNRGATYMVSGERGQNLKAHMYPFASPTVHPMNIYRNNGRVGTSYQNRGRR